MFSSCASCSKQAKQTLSRTWLVFTLFVLLPVNISESRICTRITTEKHIKVEKIKTTCVQTFEAKCGWFSLSTCTYNETFDCIKEENRTVTVYRIAEDCCPGYSRSSEGQCIRDSKAHSSLDGRQENGKIYLGLSHGAYAGIVCGVLFVACITLLTVMHYHKRKKRQKKSESAMSQLNAAQTQQMLLVTKVDSSVDT